MYEFYFDPRPQWKGWFMLCVSETKYGGYRISGILNCKNHDGSIFIKIMLCIFFSVNKMHQVYFQKVHLQKLSEKKKYQHTLCVKRKEGKRLCMLDIKKKR